MVVVPTTIWIIPRVRVVCITVTRGVAVAIVIWTYWWCIVAIFNSLIVASGGAGSSARSIVDIVTADADHDGPTATTNQTGTIS